MRQGRGAFLHDPTSHDRFLLQLHVCTNLLAPVETYTLAEYSKDIQGYNVTKSVHVEAVWPGDPVGETE